MEKELYDEYVRNGFILGELNTGTKRPLRKRTKDGVCSDKTYAWKRNAIYYAVPTEGMMVIDVDVKNGARGMESLEKLATNLFMDVDELVAMASTRTGSGGLHIPVKVSKPIKQHQDAYPDIDFQSYRANPDKCAPYVVCAGQEFEYDGKPYHYMMLTEELTLCTIDGLEDELEEDIAIDTADEDNDIFPTEHPDRALELLTHIDPCCDEPTWFKIGVVLKSHVVDGFKVFDTWSSGCPDKYDPEVVKDKWETMPNTAVANVGMIVNMAKNAKFRKAQRAIKGGTEKNLGEFFKSEQWFKEPHLSDENKQTLAREVKEELGITLPNAKKIVNQEMTEEQVKDVADKLDWLSDIAYVESFSKPYRILSTGENFGELGCSGRFHKELFALKKKLKSKANITVKGLVTRGLIPICSNHEYNPTTNEKIYADKNNNLICNLYDSSTRPQPATEYTVKGLELVDAFIKHFEIIMDKDEAKILLDWLAYSAQNFGHKILWTPLIQSAQGMGKSLIGNIMINHVFGNPNAGTADSNLVVSPQTSWATNKVFTVLEEIRLAGHNRYEVVNHLKPFITNDTISRVEKYETSSEVRNYCNFIAFTNWLDAIPVSADDRRWWVVYSRQPSLEHLEKEVGMDRYDYYEPLHELAQKDSIYGAEFHKYLLERDVSDFNPNFPPDSKHKDRMMATEDSKTSHLAELKTLINHGFKGVTKDVVSTRELRNLMITDEWDGSPLNVSETTTLLRKLNFIRFPKKIKVDGEVHNVWFSEAGISDNEIRERFRESMKLTTKTVGDMFDDLDIDEL